MKNLEQVSALLKDQASIKVVSTVSADGKVHSIVAGSVMPVDENTVCVAEVFMNTTAANLNANGTVSVLVVKGMESYLLKGKSIARQTEGELFDMLSAHLASVGLPTKAVWLFNIEEVFNEGAGPDAGSKLA